MYLHSLIAVLASVWSAAGQDAGDAAGCMLVSLVLSSHGHPVDLQPSFTRYHHDYNATLDFSMATFSVNVRPDTGCEVQAVPKRPIAVEIGGQTRVDFLVAPPQSKDVQVYRVKVFRLLGSETILQKLEVDNGALDPFPFHNETRAYTVVLDKGADEARIRYRLRDNEQRLRISAGQEVLTGSRRLDEGTASHQSSGEVQYQDATANFMLDAGFTRDVTVTIQCADPTQASIGTYTLQLKRSNCQPDKPFFDPQTRNCVNFCPEGFYRNLVSQRCSRCNTNCKVCTGLLSCKMCVPDDVEFVYVMQPDGKCQAQVNHIYARYRWWCLGLGVLLVFLVLFGCVGICTFCCSRSGKAGEKKDRRRYFEDDLEEDKQLLQFPPGRRLGRY